MATVVFLLTGTPFSFFANVCPCHGGGRCFFLFLVFFWFFSDSGTINPFFPEA